MNTSAIAELPTGRIRYTERGDGHPVVFVHGVLANAALWRNVTPKLATAGYRCITPDWPLGSHRLPMPPTAELTPPALADLITDFLSALDLTDVTLVANDTGGALTQLAMTRNPERIGRVVFTNCDCFERFFPPAFRHLPTLARIPGTIWLGTQGLRMRRLQRSPRGYGLMTRQPMSDEILDEYLLPTRRDPAIRRDLRKVLRGVHNRYTLAAAERLAEFTRPVLLAWGDHDGQFTVSLAKRLAAAMPNSTLRTVAGAAIFVPEDDPAALADLITEFLTVPAE